VDTFFALFAVLIEWPWLALLPAAAFFLAARRRRSRIALVTAMCWAVYALYEYGMKLRLLCSGECNIRVDLLVIYPALFVLSVAAVVALLVRRTQSQ
jgi:hypothetical protein